MTSSKQNSLNLSPKMSTMISTFTLNSTKRHFLLLLFFLFSPFATPLNFSFSSFQPSDQATIQPEGDAHFDQFLRLTKSATDDAKNESVGRATYATPFLIRDNATGKLADFTAHFSFAITSNNNSNTNYGDGLAFFLAPNGSFLNRTIAGGSSLGLPFNSTPSNDNFQRNQDPFVAVEFDIYPNIVPTVDDPEYDHVGIDANSLDSFITKEWSAGILGGGENNATISYNSTSKNLTVAYTTFVNSTTQVINYLDYMVDLKHYLPDWVVVGFSASTGSSVALFKIISWDFTSTPLVDHRIASSSVIVPAPAPISPVANSSYPKGRGLELGLGIGGSAVFLLGGLGLVWFILWKMRETVESSDEDPMVNEFIDDEFERGAGPRKFSYSELARATSNFGEGEKLGEGGFGGVYKGFIPDLKSHVAVKRISRGSRQGTKEYAAEVRIISRLRHRNLVQLIGWCHEKKLLLVYEFMPNGSLDTHLFKEKSLLTWDVRYKIAHGLASGLLYLHEEWDQCVLHRDIKSSNVMLDANFNPKLGDFGLARLVDHGKQSETTIVAGTRGYMAQEYVTTGKASKESDVYSFGVVALEIACGRKPIDLSLESNQIHMVKWVWELYGEGKVMEAADPKLCGDFDEKQMECLMMVGLWCANPDYNMRPSIQQAIQVLNLEVPWPILPLEMPVATFPLRTSLSMMSAKSTTGSEASQIQSLYSQSTNSLHFTSSSATNSLPSQLSTR